MANAPGNVHRNSNGSAAASAAGTGAGSAGIFVFEADTAAFANRKRAARACASCQKRKKRCPHTFSKGQQDGTGLLNSSVINVNGTGSDGVDKVLPNLTHKEPIRFVGDLNPESILTDLSSSEKGARKSGKIGTWIEQSRLRSELHRGEDEMTANATSETGPTTTTATRAPRLNEFKCAAVERYSKIERGRRTLTGHQKNYLQAVGAFRVLPKATEDALVTTYISCIDQLLPIVDGPKFLEVYAAGEASVFLVQAICLVACKTEEAAPYLRLYEDGPVLDPIPFARSLHTGLDAAMKADLEADRVTKVQIMTLMSLHNDGPGGIEESSLHLVQAIHDAQTTGMHIKTPGRTRNDQGAQLWWTLCMLDKFNACLGGRPLMVSERDIDIDEPEPQANPRSQALAVWMTLSHLLGEVIEYYRPVADPDATGWEQDFPSWDVLTEDCDLDALLPSHRNILELCYNIIGILACRSGGPSTISYNRRIVCADRIQALMIRSRVETQSSNGHSYLAPIPLVPYAVSLSLTVVYRGLRDHHTDPARALADLGIRVEMLENLSRTWWTADAMAKLGRKALKSLQHPLQPSQPGKPGLTDIGDVLDAEVGVCKYGPFTELKNGPTTRIDPVTSTSDYSSHEAPTGNALHVLSDAAATHGLHKSSTKTKRLSTTEINHDHEVNAKRRRMHRSRHSLSGGVDTLTPSSTNSSSPNLTNTSAIPTPHTNATSSLHSKNRPAFSETTSDAHTTMDSSIHNSSLLHEQSVAHSHDPMNIDPFPTFADYNSLDNLFDGFFDLSMPTIFQDPLFDGAAFMNNPVIDDYSFMDPATTVNTFDYGSGSGDGNVLTMSAIGGHGQIDPRLGLSLVSPSFTRGDQVNNSQSNNPSLVATTNLSDHGRGPKRR